MTKPFAYAPNARMVTEDVLACGQPTPETLDQSREAGCRTVVNLRPDSELQSFDEAAEVENRGMRYVHIPIAGPPDLTADNARRLHEALTADSAVPALVHCGSANRVGALFALRASVVEGRTPEQALEIGLDAGLDANSPLYLATRNSLPNTQQ